MTQSTASRRSGVVLIAVLLVVVLLSLAAYQYAEVMTAEYKAADSAARAGQAKSLAASGIHYAAALLSDRNSMANVLNNNPYDNSSAFQGITVNNSDIPRFQGRFSVVAPLSPDESAADAGSFRYGVTDESSKINLNTLLQLDSTGTVARQMLLKLPNMTEEIADAILDWIDADDDQRASGAESQYYSGLSPSYRCKNGPLDSLEELLLVKGVTPELLFGSDRNRNGAPDQGEAAEGGGQDRGWAAYLTVYSREKNIDSEGQPRIFLNDKDINGLYDKLVTALGTEVADFVLAYRLYGAYSSSSSSSASSPSASSSARPGGNTVSTTRVTEASGPVTKDQLDLAKRPSSISSIFALVDAKVGVSKTVSETISVVGPSTPQRPGSAPQPPRTTSQTVQITMVTVYTSPLADSGKQKQYLPILLDKCTTRSSAEIPPRINISTASAAVLATLPGLEDTDVQTILSRRPAPGSSELADPVYQTMTWLLTEANLKPSTLRALERYVSSSSQVYRVQSLGFFDKGGPLARIEAVIDTNGGNPRIVYWRDLSELGKGFDIQR